MEQAAHNCGEFAKYFWNHPELKMREVWEIVNKHRAYHDYSGMPSHVKMDFYRQYYHTRARTKVIPDTDKDGEAIYAPYVPSGFEEVETRIWFESFLNRLDNKDREIVRFLEEGYNQEEIAEMLCYANHSGVCKRVKIIRKEFEKFRQE